jgi:S-adenosylmethionine synthetase
MSYLFTSESVSEGHPDKVADQVSDALLDEFLRHDPDAKVACETLVTTGLVVCAGEVRTESYIDIQETVRKTLRSIGYNKAEYQFEANSCGILSSIHEQSGDIRQGVMRDVPENQGAGDQGMMFGYACREQDNFMPLPIELAHDLLYELADIRHHDPGLMPYLRPDAKSQVTVLYGDDNKPVKIETVVISTQHDEFVTPRTLSAGDRQSADAAMQARIKNDILSILIPRLKESYRQRGNLKAIALFGNDMKLLVNPTGKFVIGGPHGDTGLTGRKIIVDTYGGRGAHGGGAFSGKDASKVDRSAAYAARHIAKNMVAAGIADEVLLQVAYAIGIAEPVGVYVNTNGSCKVKNDRGELLKDSEVAGIVSRIFDLRPYAIINHLGLKNPIFFETAKYGHFGREYRPGVEVQVFYDEHTDKSVCRKNVNGETLFFKKADLFSWEKLDYVDRLKEEFGIK